MNGLEAWPALVFGGILVLLGAAMMWSHVRTWRRRRERDDVYREDHAYFFVQFRRRMQTSGLLALLGAMIIVGVQWGWLRQHPGVWGVYWLCVLVLTLWVGLLAVGDYFTVRSHGESAMQRLEAQRLEAERELERLRRQAQEGRNGNR